MITDDTRYRRVYNDLLAVRAKSKDPHPAKETALLAELEEYERTVLGEALATGFYSAEQIGFALVRRRFTLGATQADIARELEIPTTTLGEWERMRYASVNLLKIARAAAALGLRMSVTLEEKDLSAESHPAHQQKG